jgi:ABC-type uncharacterized transport system permease subunit
VTAADEQPPVETPEQEIPSVAARLALYQRAGGVITPLFTALFAFFVGGLVVLVTIHKNPLVIYKAIFNGTGLNWLFPWVHGDARTQAALDLQQTLILTIPLILTALAVAFAFRCGLFNIGGQGQYIVGSIASVQMGIWFGSMWGPAHVALAVAAAAAAGAAWAGIAGILRATVGAHEVITTIMLNWIALWVGSYLVGFGGPMQDKSGPAGGIEAVAGAFAGMAGAMDLLGWEHKLDLTEVQGASIPFIGIAVALLGRNTAVGILFSSLLFGALLNGTSERSADLANAIQPELAGNLTRIIQGLVVLFVGADVLILYVWQARRRLRLGVRRVVPR